MSEPITAPAATFTTAPDFERASRLKLRFDSPKGQLTVEDLWDLPLTSATNRANLDSIAVALHRQTREAAEVVSFVDKTAPTGSDELLLKFEIVRHVIRVRVAERDAARDLADRAEKKKRILALIEQKKDEALAGKSVEELLALAESL